MILGPIRHWYLLEPTEPAARPGPYPVEPVPTEGKFPRPGRALRCGACYSEPGLLCALKACASLASMAALLRGAGSDHRHLPRIGRQPGPVERLLDRAVSQRQRLTAAGLGRRFFDVPFGQLQLTPGRGQALCPFWLPVKEAGRAFLIACSRGKHGLHPPDRGCRHRSPG